MVDYSFKLLHCKMAVLQMGQIIERKLQNFVVEDLIGMEESESLILFYSQSIWKIVGTFKLTQHIGFVALFLYKRFTLNTPIFKYDCKIAAIACVFLATKLENGYQLTLKQVCKRIIGIKAEDVKACEMLILEGNDYELYIKTPWLPLLCLYNDFESLSQEQYKECVKYLELTMNGDVIYLNSPSKLATASVLAVFGADTVVAETFKLYLQEKYTVAKQNEQADTTFAQWYKELNDIVDVLKKEVKYDNEMLKDINNRLLKYRNEHFKPENNSDSIMPTKGTKRSVPSPQTGTQPSKK